MRGFRVVGGVVCTLAIGAVSLPAQATDAASLPFVSTKTEEYCDQAAKTAGAANCRVVGRASASNGAVSAETNLVSPTGGTTAWSADANSTGLVGADYRLTQPVRQLDFVVEAQVIRARATLSPGASGRVGWYLDPTLVRYADAVVGAYAVHSACMDCGGGHNVTVVETRTPGTTVATSGQRVVLRVRVSRSGGQEMPPGIVTVRAGAHTVVSQSRSWGDDSAVIDAIVTRIAPA